MMRFFEEFSKKQKYFFVIIMLAALVVRVLAFQWNLPYQHDNYYYGKAAESFAQNGTFKISSDYSTGIAHSYSVATLGGEYLDHNPLWPLLGALVVFVTGLNGYVALMVLSLIFGLMVCVLVYKISALLLNKNLALVALALAAFSYVLIDFSGNGSFYIFQSFLYLLFIWTYLSHKKSSAPIVLGLVTAAAVLTVHQSIALVATYLVCELYANWRAPRTLFKNGATFMLLLVVLYLPWGIRNHYLLGNFFPPSDTYYIWDKLGVAKVLEGDITHYQITAVTYLKLIKTELTSWFPNNLYFIIRQLFVLVPVLFVAAVFAIIEIVAGVLKKDSDTRRYLPVALVLVFHVAISAAWPITKFRYFVAMVPLIVILGLWYASRFLQSKFARQWVLVVSVFGALVVSVLFYFGSKAHTSYYGGIITTDPFGRQWEIEYIQSLDSGAATPE